MKYFSLYTIIVILNVTITNYFFRMLRSIITVNTIIVIIEFGWILDAVFVRDG